MARHKGPKSSIFGYCTSQTLKYCFEEFIQVLFKLNTYILTQFQRGKKHNNLRTKSLP